MYQHIRFDYQQARASRTALEAFRERTGVCRDYTHLAITLWRCMNIPARYCTGYLGDIGVPPSSDPFQKESTEAFDELRPQGVTSKRPNSRIANLSFQTGCRTIQRIRQALLAIIRMTK